MDQLLDSSRYFIKALKSIFLKGLGIEFLLLEIAILAVFAGGRSLPGQFETQEETGVGMFERSSICS